MTLWIFEAPPHATELAEWNKADTSISYGTSKTVSEVLDLPTITYPGEFPGETALRAWIIEQHSSSIQLNQSFHIIFTDGTLYSALISENPKMELEDIRTTTVGFHRIDKRD